MLDDRFYDLASRYLDGATSDADEAELAERLKADEDARREMARLVNQHGALRWAFAEAKPSRRSRRRRSTPSSSSAPWAWAAAAAALFAVVVLAAVSGTSRRPAAPPKTEARRAVVPPPAPEPPAEIPAPPAPPPPDTKAPEPFVPPPPPPPGTKAPDPFVPSPPKPSPAPAPPVIAEAPPKESVAAPAPVAALEAVDGATLDGRPAQAGDPLLLGQVVEGRARLRWPDGTRIDLAGALSTKGRATQLTLSRGELAADVAKQPADQPLLIATPHGEARVLGTRFTLRVEAEGTRLEVHEGKVRLSKEGIAAVDVVAGHYAVASPKVPLASRPLPLEIFRISFGPNDGSLPPDFAADDGSVFDAARGWGWDRDLRKNTRNRMKGSALERRQISAGSASRADRWEIAVPNGRYLLTVSCGDAMATQQGPHRVVAEGVAVVRDVMTKAGKACVVEGVPIEVRDGRFTLEAGAVGTPRQDRDASADTILNYLILQRTR